MQTEAMSHPTGCARCCDGPAGSFSPRPWCEDACTQPPPPGNRSARKDALTPLDCSEPFRCASRGIHALKMDRPEQGDDVAQDRADLKGEELDA